MSAAMSSRPTAQWKAEGRCTNCGGERHGELQWCGNCRRLHRTRRKRLRNSRVATGKCSFCLVQPAAPGYKRCFDCLDRNNKTLDRALTWRQRAVVTHRRNERLVQNNVYLRERVAELNRTIENMAKSKENG